MKVEVESHFDTGDNIDIIKNGGREPSTTGTIVKVEWDSSKYEFRYLVELPDESRLWVSEDNNTLLPHYSPTETLEDVIKK